MADKACEAGTAPSTSDRSIEDAAYVRSTDGLWVEGSGAVNSNLERDRGCECVMLACFYLK